MEKIVAMITDGADLRSIPEWINLDVGYITALLWQLTIAF